jgi:hypothetical protein
MARESKAELTDRLRSEGRWEEFKKRREQLRADGILAKDAWRQAAMEFPPQDDPANKNIRTRPITKTDFRAFRKKPEIRIGQALRWAFDHLEADWLRPRDAPSIGAWSIREWARSNPTARMEFYRLFAAKLSSIPSEDETTPRQLSKRDREFYIQCGFTPPDLPRGWTRTSPPRARGG